MLSCASAASFAVHTWHNPACPVYTVMSWNQHQLQCFVSHSRCSLGAALLHNTAPCATPHTMSITPLFAYMAAKHFWSQASGGEWNKDLLFTVPREHEEMQRLEGRYGKYECSPIACSQSIATDHSGNNQASMFFTWQTGIITLLFYAAFVCLHFAMCKISSAGLQCIFCLLPVGISASCFQVCKLCSVGGLKKGLVVELANGSNAMVLEVTGGTKLSPHACICILGLWSWHTKPPQCVRPPTLF